jgi:hypothetical protein
VDAESISLEHAAAALRHLGSKFVGGTVRSGPIAKSGPAALVQLRNPTAKSIMTVPRL